MTTKLPWRKPKVIVVETVGPYGCCKMFTLYDGRRIIVPGRPIVTEARHRGMGQGDR